MKVVRSIMIVVVLIFCRVIEWCGSSCLCYATGSGLEQVTPMGIEILVFDIAKSLEICLVAHVESWKSSRVVVACVSDVVDFVVFASWDFGNRANLAKSMCHLNGRATGLSGATSRRWLPSMSTHWNGPLYVLVSLQDLLSGGAESMMNTLSPIWNIVGFALASCCCFCSCWVVSKFCRAFCQDNLKSKATWSVNEGLSLYIDTWCWRMLSIGIRGSPVVHEIKWRIAYRSLCTTVVCECYKRDDIAPVGLIVVHEWSYCRLECSHVMFHNSVRGVM